MKTQLAIVLSMGLAALSCSKLSDDLPAPVTPGVKVHESGWLKPSATNFHGTVLKAENWDDTQCKQCHGGTFSGGTAGVSCFTCHAPYPHSVAFGTTRHTGYVDTHGYPLTQCQACHGTDYTGGAVEVTCQRSGCHADAAGNLKSPETCNTCHGNFRASASLTGTALLVSAAPPRGLNNDTTTTSYDVGAHQNHLAAGLIGKDVKCQECHSVPATALTPTHPFGGRATVAFNDTLARLVTGDGSVAPAPTYAAATSSCANTYCHGTWRLRMASAPLGNQIVYTDSVIEGTKASPVWTAGMADAQCTSCHGQGGFATPAGHVTATLAACYSCHGDVVDANGNILNKAKHINGYVDLASNWVSHKMQ